MSYTTYEYSDLTVPERVARGEDIEISVKVTNTGKVAGQESVLLFINDEVSSVATPVRELKAFNRVALAPGQSQMVELRVKFNQLALYNRSLDRVVESGMFRVMVEGQEALFEVVD